MYMRTVVCDNHNTRASIRLLDSNYEGNTAVDCYFLVLIIENEAGHEPQCIPILFNMFSPDPSARTAVRGPQKCRLITLGMHGLSKTHGRNLKIKISI